jgi:predicted transcriptional regulator
MILELTPAQQEILEQAIRTGRNREDVVNEAFTLLRQSLELDEWMLANRDEVVAHVEEGIAQAEHGELIPDYEVRRILDDRIRQREIA